MALPRRTLFGLAGALALSARRTQALRLLLTAVAMFGASSSLVAQARSGRVEVRGGAAAATTPYDFLGPVFTGQLGLVLSTRTELTLDLAYQAFEVQLYPEVDEAYATHHVMLGIQVGLGQSRRTYVRPEIGVALETVSRANASTTSETLAALGFAIGREFQLGAHLGLAPELFTRVASSIDTSALMGGLAVSVVFVGARTASR